MEIVGRLRKTRGEKFVHLYHTNGTSLLARVDELPSCLVRDGDATLKDYSVFEIYATPFGNGPC